MGRLDIICNSKVIINQYVIPQDHFMLIIVNTCSDHTAAGILWEPPPPKSVRESDALTTKTKTGIPPQSWSWDFNTVNACVCHPTPPVAMLTCSVLWLVMIRWATASQTCVQGTKHLLSDWFMRSINPDQALKINRHNRFDSELLWTIYTCDMSLVLLCRYQVSAAVLGPTMRS